MRRSKCGGQYHDHDSELGCKILVTWGPRCVFCSDYVSAGSFHLVRIKIFGSSIVTVSLTVNQLG